jgi:hypothetical protein
VPTIAGVGGGVGVTTLARLLQAADEGVYAGQPVRVLVCRSTASSTAAATVAVASQAVQATGPVLAVVGDGPWPTPAAVRARLRMLEPHVPKVVHVPYVGRWRELDDPLAADAPAPPKPFRAAITTLIAAISAQHAAHQAAWPDGHGDQASQPDGAGQRRPGGPEAAHPASTRREG